MTKEQIEVWIKNEIKTHPEVAEEYKKQRLARLQAELRDNQRAFDREGYMSYRSPAFGRMIVENNEEIKKVEHKTAEELLIYDFTERYSLSQSEKESIEFIKHLSEEDHYIEGLFKDTEYSYIRCKEDFDNKADRDYYKKICAMYKKGLSKRDEYIKIGAKSHQELLIEREKNLLQADNIDKKGPEKIQEMIDYEISLKKQFCRNLAEMSVVDAFDLLGSHPTQKESEEIEKIINLHDPDMVEKVAQRLANNPTRNMVDLARNISEAPAQSRKELKVMKAVDIFSLITGTTLTTLGIVGAATGNPALLTTAMLGMGNLGLGIIGMLRHTRKTDNLNERDALMSKCIGDFLNEVVLEETFNKGLER